MGDGHSGTQGNADALLSLLSNIETKCGGHGNAAAMCCGCVQEDAGTLLTGCLSILSSCARDRQAAYPVSRCRTGYGSNQLQNEEMARGVFYPARLVKHVKDCGKVREHPPFPAVPHSPPLLSRPFP